MYDNDIKEIHFIVKTEKCNNSGQKFYRKDVYLSISKKKVAQKVNFR